MDYICKHCGQTYSKIAPGNYQCQCGEEFILEAPIGQSVKHCPMCGEKILSVAKKCKHCQSMLDGTSSAPAQQVNVTGIDPFAKYHSDIQGKKKGRLTFVGMLGILLGVGFICLGVALLPKGDGEAGFMTMLLGIGIALACYLWARAPKKHNK